MFVLFKFNFHFDINPIFHFHSHILHARPRSQHTMTVRQCKPRDVTLHLKAGSYPVISPENITFPKHFLHPDQR